MKKLLLLLLLIPNLVMAEKWIPFIEGDGWERFYDEESMKDNKDGTYSLVVKSINLSSQKELNKQEGSMGSYKNNLIVSCSPLRILSGDWSIFRNKDLSDLMQYKDKLTNCSDGPCPFNVSTLNLLEKKICGKNNITPAPTLSPKVSIDDAKIQCEDIGFKPKTERFGECVLELNK